MLNIFGAVAICKCCSIHFSTQLFIQCIQAYKTTFSEEASEQKKTIKRHNGNIVYSKSCKRHPSRKWFILLLIYFHALARLNWEKDPYNKCCCCCCCLVGFRKQIKFVHISPYPVISRVNNFICARVCMCVESDGYIQHHPSSTYFWISLSTECQILACRFYRPQRFQNIISHRHDNQNWPF